MRVINETELTNSDPSLVHASIGMNAADKIFWQNPDTVTPPPPALSGP